MFYITGMSETMFHGVIYKRKLNCEEIELIVVDSPGKGKRRKEEKLHDFNATVDDIADEIHKKISQREPFMLLGYSMGAYLSVEVYYSLEEKYGVLPACIVLMGMEHPDKKIMEKIRTRDRSILETVLEERTKLNPEMTETRIHKVLMEAPFHDLKVYRTYSYVPKDHKIQCPVTLIYGSLEYDYEYEKKVLPLIQELVQHKMNMVCFEANHLFGLTMIPEIKEELIKIIIGLGVANE